MGGVAVSLIVELATRTLSPLKVLSRTRPLRMMTWATLVNTIGTGIWAAGSALYFTRFMGLEPAVVGLGLTLAGVVGLLASVPAGYLADRFDPRLLRASLQAILGLTTLCWPFVHSFKPFVAIALIQAVATAGSLTARGTLIAGLAGEHDRMRAFASLRSVASFGLAIGAGLAGIAISMDAPSAYLTMVLTDALTFVGSAFLTLQIGRIHPQRSVEPVKWWLALNEPRYVAVSAVIATTALLQGVLTFAAPLWIVERTSAPTGTISILLLLHTGISVLLSLPVGELVTRAENAARVMAVGGLAAGVGLALFPLTNNHATIAVVAILLGATVGVGLGELGTTMAGSAMAFSFAPPTAIGQYQALNVMAYGLGGALSPYVLSVLVLGNPPEGWLILGAIIAAAGVAGAALVRSPRSATG